MISEAQLKPPALACKIIAVLIWVFVATVFGHHWAGDSVAVAKQIVLTVLSLVPNRWLVFSRISFVAFLLISMIPFWSFLDPAYYRNIDVSSLALLLIFSLFLFSPLPLSLILSRMRLIRGGRFLIA